VGGRARGEGVDRNKNPLIMVDGFHERTDHDWRLPICSLIRFFQKKKKKKKLPWLYTMIDGVFGCFRTMVMKEPDNYNI